MFAGPLTNTGSGRKGYLERLSMKVLVNKGRQGFRCARLGGVAVALFCLASIAAFAAQTGDNQPPPSVMPWVSDVVKMNNAGIAPDVIANYVRNTDARSSLTADDIIYLRDNGISSGLITAMIQHGAVPPSTPTAQPVPMPATPAPAPAYAQVPAPDYSDYQPQPAVNYNYYTSPDYSYSTPYWYWNYYYPYYPVWFFNSGFGFHNRFGFRHGFDFDRGRSFGRSGFRGGFGGGFHSGGVHGFSSGHFGGGMGGRR